VAFRDTTPTTTQTPSLQRPPSPFPFSSPFIRQREPSSLISFISGQKGERPEQKLFSEQSVT
jgi:hypothetical protein